jgi:hypothetical protein
LQKQSYKEEASQEGEEMLHAVHCLLVSLELVLGEAILQNFESLRWPHGLTSQHR